MPEMRAETERKAKRKGIASEPAKPHVSTREREDRAPIDPTGSERQPHPATQEEHLRSSGRIERGATGGPS